MKNLMFLAVLIWSTTAFAQGTETRKLGNFRSVEAGGSFDTEIEQGNENTVTIEAKGVDPEKIVTEVKGDVLKVYMKRGNYNNIRTTVYVTYKNLEGVSGSGSGNLVCKSAFSAPNFTLSNSGSGNLECQDGIKAKNLSLDLSGSGNVSLTTIEAEDFEVSMSGSGNLKAASGYANRLTIDKSGSGNIKAYGVKSEVCAVDMSGSGNVDISADKSIEGSISGSADLNYQGDATVSNMRTSGSGNVNKQ